MVYALAIEFALRKDQELVDKLITDEVYDDNLAKTISLNTLLSIGIGGYKDIIRYLKVRGN